MNVDDENQDMHCAISQCNRNLYAKEICFAHYMQAYRGGTPGPIRKRNNSPPDKCTVTGCDRPYTARGMCMKHYQYRRRGNNSN